MTDLRDEKTIVDGVTTEVMEDVSLADLMGYKFESVPANGVREFELSAEQHAAAYGVAGRPTRMDRRPGDPPIKHAEKSALDVFGPPPPGDRIHDIRDRLADALKRKTEDQE